MEIAEPSILIRINQRYQEGMSGLSLLEATRGYWRVGPSREKAQLAFAVYRGMVKEVYRIISWCHAGTLEYETRNDLVPEGRWEFNCELAPPDIRERYVNESVAEYFTPGAQNPITYVNC